VTYDSLFFSFLLLFPKEMMLSYHRVMWFTCVQNWLYLRWTHVGSWVYMGPFFPRSTFAAESCHGQNPWIWFAGSLCYSSSKLSLALLCRRVVLCCYLHWHHVFHMILG